MNPTPTADPTLLLKKPRRHAWLLWLILLFAAAGGGYVWLQQRPAQDAPQYLTQAVERSDLRIKVSATGNLEPINQVDVGSELSGMIERVLVDDNDRVTQGQVLARLDARRFADQVQKSRAALLAAKAQVEVAQATVFEAKSQLHRLRELAKRSGGQMVSAAEMTVAEANLARAEANASLARANVDQAQAQLQSDETNLGKTEIRSPINGVVLTRKAEPGMTVAASLQSPVLFTLAEDLKRMQLNVAVDEADVAQVKEGQKARFTVDAWRGRTFPADIIRVNFGSQIKDGVVSYPTLLSVNNDALELRPGMTATAEILTQTREGVLLVPNAALRFNPATTPPPAKPSGLVASLTPQMPKANSQRASKKSSNDGQQSVYVLRDGQAVDVKIKTGVSDGKFTEVLQGELQEGDKVITERQVKKS